jgi:hypothetical protein
MLVDVVLQSEQLPFLSTERVSTLFPFSEPCLCDTDIFTTPADILPLR